MAEYVSGSMDSLVLGLATRLGLEDLQALSHTCRALRQAVQALPALAWQLSAARTVPAYHPLPRAADVPARANSFCSAARALNSGSFTSQHSSLDSLDALLLQPDLTR